MTRHAPRWRLLLLINLAFATAAAAQGIPPEPPGPFVVDLRGGTIGLPEFTGFYPPLPEETRVPARGFGLDAGAHVYFTKVGPGRLGAGASVMFVRGTAADVSATARLLTPQLSINFGTSDGWSYISGGAGLASVRGRFNDTLNGTDDSRESTQLLTFNLGGGARWFITNHLAIGFDVRMHRLGAWERDGELVTPATFLGSASVGFSVK